MLRGHFGTLGMWWHDGTRRLVQVQEALSLPTRQETVGKLFQEQSPKSLDVLGMDDNIGSTILYRRFWGLPGYQSFDPTHIFCINMSYLKTCRKSKLQSYWSFCDSHLNCLAPWGGWSIPVSVIWVPRTVWSLPQMVSAAWFRWISPRILMYKDGLPLFTSHYSPS